MPRARVLEPCVQCGAPVYAARVVTIDDGRHEGEDLCSFACAERRLLDEITPRRGKEAKG